MVIFALHLAHGSTMLSSTIKYTTIKRHLKASSSIPFTFKQLGLLLDTRGLDEQCIKEVLSEVNRWKFMSNRREPVTVKIVLHMQKRCKNKHLDSLDPALCDWIVLCMFYGFRLYEWSQNKLNKTRPLAGPEGLSLAFFFPDLTFLGAYR